MAKLSNVILITSTGLVGGNLLKVFNQKNFKVIESFYPEIEKGNGFGVDITKPVLLEGVFGEAKPDVVVLNAALTHVDLCEENKPLAYKINVEGTQNVAQLCAKFCAKMVFFSSDYVFDGQNGPYSETDMPNPIGYYGQTKLDAERLIQRILSDFLIIRTTVVYGHEQMGKNFCYRLINTLQQEQSINVPKDQVGNPTYAYNLSEVVVELIEKEEKGVFNVVGKDLIDRFEFALAVCREFGLNKDLVKPITTAELNQKAKRPLNAGLKINKVENTVKTKILGVSEGLKLFKKELGWKN